MAKRSGDDGDRRADAELIAAARNDDQGAWRVLVGRSNELLRRYLAKRTGSAEVEDLVQDVWARAFKALSTFDVRGEHSVQAWLLRIAERAAIDRRRRTSALKNAEGEAVSLASRGSSVRGRRPGSNKEVSAPSQHARERELRKRLARGLRGLTAQERRIVVKARLHKRPHAEIMRELGIANRKTFVAKLGRALHKLSDELGELAPGAKS